MACEQSHTKKGFGRTVPSGLTNTYIQSLNGIDSDGVLFEIPLRGPNVVDFPTANESDESGWFNLEEGKYFHFKEQQFFIKSTT